MPKQVIDAHSGAVLFIPTPEEKEVKELKGNVKTLEGRIKELEKLLLKK